GRNSLRWSSPARRRATTDEIGVQPPRLAADRLADRARPDGVAMHLDPVVGAEQLRLGERSLGALLLVPELRVERPVERDTNDMQGVDRGAAFLRELHRRRDHL